MENRTSNIITFNKYYFGLTILIFCIEVIIAIFIHDTFVRPYLGDVLVVILMYCFLKSFLSLRMSTAATLVLLFAFTIEFLQLIDIVEKLGLGHSKIARIVIGTSFSILDLVCYTVGILVTIGAEKYFSRKN